MLIDFDTIIIFYVGLYAIVKISGIITGRRNIKVPCRIKIMRFIFGLYIAIVLGVTIFPVELPPMRMTEDVTVYLNFETFSFMKEGWSLSVAKHVLGNVLMFVPIYPLATLSGMNEKSWYQVVLGILAFSLSIEAIQFAENIIGLSGFFGRVTDVNDLFLNTIGGMIGFFCVSMYQKYKHCCFSKRHV